MTIELPGLNKASGANRPPETSQAEAVATRVVFFIAGVSLASWAPLIPFAKARSGIDDRGLGLLLLCLGIGSIVAMSTTGGPIKRFGCRRVIVAAVLPLGLTLPFLASVGNPLLLAAALLVFGASLGVMEVGMNIQAIVVERAEARPMMSGFHGFFSLGGMTGAAGMAALIGAGLAPPAATLCVVAGIVVALLAAAPFLLPYGSQAAAPTFALAHGVVLFIGALCFVAFLAEGAMLDWSAVFLTSVRGLPAGYAGLGYAVFSLAMTLGRLTGDRIVRRFGATGVFVSGAICAAVGLVLVALVPLWSASLLGYGLTGLGCSNLVPILFTGVGRQTVVPEHLAVPAITTMGYAGILLGPAAIGFVAHAASLSAAFLILALLQLGVAASWRWVRI